MEKTDKKKRNCKLADFLDPIDYKVKKSKE